MVTSSIAQDQRQIIARIDIIIRELEALRRQLTVPSKEAPPRGLTDELFGAAGRGTRDEYDLQLDWARFNE
jgi:hypothetical protein